MELLRSLAGVLAAAHRLGLAHGRLHADHVFLTAEGQIKLDFSGASVGFPDAGTRIQIAATAENRAAAESLAALRSADLHGLGVLIARLDGGLAVSPRDAPLPMTAREHSELGTLARELMARDPAERPLAHEVQTRLARLLHPMDATGDWSEPDQALEPGTMS